MRIAIISDIHGNAVALETALKAINQDAPDQIVCLGDAVQGGPLPAEVIASLRDLACPIVMGNADAWLLSGQETGEEAISPERRRQLDETRLWSLAQLSPDDLEFMRTFQPTIEIPLGADQNLLGFHGSPTSFDTIILPSISDDDFQALLTPYLPRIMCGGHTHVQFIRRLRDSFFFNPGSIGVTYNHDQDDASFHFNPWIEYALLTFDHPHQLNLDFRRIPLDVQKLKSVYLSSGIPFAENAVARYQ